MRSPSPVLRPGRSNRRVPNPLGLQPREAKSGGFHVSRRVVPVRWSLHAEPRRLLTWLQPEREPREEGTTMTNRVHVNPWRRRGVAARFSQSTRQQKQVECSGWTLSPSRGRCGSQPCEARKARSKQRLLDLSLDDNPKPSFGCQNERPTGTWHSGPVTMRDRATSRIRECRPCLHPRDDRSRRPRQGRSDRGVEPGIGRNGLPMPRHEPPRRIAVPLLPGKSVCARDCSNPVQIAALTRMEHRDSRPQRNQPILWPCRRGSDRYLRECSAERRQGL